MNRQFSYFFYLFFNFLSFYKLFFYWNFFKYNCNINVIWPAIFKYGRTKLNNVNYFIAII